MKVKSLDVAKKRYKSSTSIVASRYKDGVSSANWKEKASSQASEDLWKAKLQEAMNANRRKKAIELVSNEEWRKNAIDKGSQRIAQGMTQSIDKWASNTAPYLDVLRSTELPDRVADPVQNVRNRVIPVVEALVAKKKEILGE